MKLVFRLDISCLDTLPDYMKFLYRIVLDLYGQIEQEMRNNNGREYALNYQIKEVRVFFTIYVSIYSRKYLLTFFNIQTFI